MTGRSSSSKQVKVFNDYNEHCVKEMNEFMLSVEVIDVKMQIVVSPAGPFFTQYMVIYK